MGSRPEWAGAGRKHHTYKYKPLREGHLQTMGCKCSLNAGQWCRRVLTDDAKGRYNSQDRTTAKAIQGANRGVSGSKSRPGSEQYHGMTCHGAWYEHEIDANPRGGIVIRCKPRAKTRVTKEAMAKTWQPRIAASQEWISV